MSGFAMKTAGVFLPLHPGTKARMAHAAARLRANGTAITARRQDEGNDRGLEAHKITALTSPFHLADQGTAGDSRLRCGFACFFLLKQVNKGMLVAFRVGARLL